MNGFRFAISSDPPTWSAEQRELSHSAAVDQPTEREAVRAQLLGYEAGQIEEAAEWELVVHRDWIAANMSSARHQCLQRVAAPVNGALQYRVPSCVALIRAQQVG